MRIIMSKDELTNLSWEITQILCKCDTQREAFNLMIATIGAFVAFLYEDKNDRVAALEFVRRNMCDFIKTVEKGAVY